MVATLFTQAPRAAQERLTASGEFVGADGHGHGVVGSRPEHLDPRVVAAAGVDADEVPVRVISEQFVERAIVGAGHRRVDHHHVGLERLGEDRCRFGIGR